MTSGYSFFAYNHGLRLTYRVYKEGTELRNKAGLTNETIMSEEEFNQVMDEQDRAWGSGDTFYV